MTSLLLRYAAPLMAFGHTGRFDDRPTAATPTVSAIQGMIAAAAGISREQSWPDWIAQLHLAIRIDRPGRIISDYHTVNQPPHHRFLGLADADRDRVAVVAQADHARKDTTVVSRRSYLADACFLLALHDPDGRIRDALTAPAWHLYAGRKACPLTEPLLLGTTPDTPEQAIARTPTVQAPLTGDTVTRNAIVLRPLHGDVRIEDRNDRGAGFRRHRQQRRWHTTVAVAAVADWFDVNQHLMEAPR